jgi:hypothetical protein
MQPYVSKKPDEQGEEDLFQLFDPEGIEFWNFLKQHKDKIITMVNTYHAETLSNQQQATTEKKELNRLGPFVKEYFAELFLASMSIIGMILAVLYILAHTWR